MNERKAKEREEKILFGLYVPIMDMDRLIYMEFVIINGTGPI